MTHSFTDPLPNETPKAFSAFCVYRDMGKSRSLDKVAQKANKSRTYKTHLARWSTKYHWVERVRAFDLDNLERQRIQDQEARRLAHDEELAEYRKQLAQSSKAALSVGQRALKLAMDKLRKLTDKDISAKDLPALIRASNDTIEKAMDGWGMALNVDDLIDFLSDDDAS